MADEVPRDESVSEGPGEATAGYGGVRDRETHLAWCKQRALEYAERGELVEAVTSMGSDLNKHPETKANNQLVAYGLMLAVKYDFYGVRRWIEGWR